MTTDPQPVVTHAPPADLPPGIQSGRLLLWLGIQLLALLVPAIRLPLAVKYPEPQELLAVAIMLAVQVGAASLLFPILMADSRTAAVVIATAWPFQMLAAALAATPPARVVGPGAYVTAWLASLALWRAMLRRDDARHWGVAVASGASIGGAALWYLRLEATPEDVVAPAAFGPLLGALATSADTSSLSIPWVWPLASLLAAALCGAAIHFRRRPDA